MVDTRLECIIDLQQTTSYRYLPALSSEEPRFLLLAGDPEDLAHRINEHLTTPTSARLVGNFPNPFNPATVIAYEIGKSEQVRLSIYDVRGRLVVELRNGVGEPGRYEALWQGHDGRGIAAPSGVYFVKLATGSA